MVPIGLFEIDAATGELFYNASAPLSYKITSQYVLSLDVSDGLHTTSTQITVQVVAAGSDGGARTSPGSAPRLLVQRRRGDELC